MAQAKSPGTGVVNREEEIQRQIQAQQRMLAGITTSAKFISFKGGQIIIDGKVVPGGKTDVIPLAFMSERAYFPTFDPDVRQSPLCYAYSNGEEDEVMAPHKEAKQPQAKTCAECPRNEWGSAEKGRGKACRESVRVALLPSATNVEKEATWHCRIPITSVPSFKNYAGELLGMGKPLHAAVARLTVVPDAKTMLKVSWDPVKALDPKLFAIVDAKAASAANGIDFPYPDFEDESKAAPAKQLKTKRK